MPEQRATTAEGRRPTIKDVAERAHVSKSLVSLVLRDSPKVSDASRSAVLEAIDELGYRPSAAARSLVSGRSHTIGVVISDPHNPAYASMMEGIQTSASAAGLSPLIMHGQQEAEPEDRIVDRFIEYRVDALIFLGSDLSSERLTAIGEQLPVVVVGRRMKSDALDVVTADSWSGAAQVVDHLVKLGHQHIGHIDATLSTAEPGCLAGYIATMEAHGLTPNVVTGSVTQAGGESGARQFLEQGRFPSGIFAASDLSALGAREVIRGAGLSIPKQVSLVGYNDSALAGLRGIELTSVHVPFEAMGIYASEVVVNRILDPTEPPSQWIVEPELVARGSTRPPAG
jgi:DNA-binding LacI/PurR family transcriptional regulator